MIEKYTLTPSNLDRVSKRVGIPIEELRQIHDDFVARHETPMIELVLKQCKNETTIPVYVGENFDFPAVGRAKIEGGSIVFTIETSRLIKDVESLIDPNQLLALSVHLAYRPVSPKE